MTNKEKENIKKLGTLYVCTGEMKSNGCGGSVTKQYKEIDIFKYLKDCEYNEKLSTYIKYRNSKRFNSCIECSGRISYYESEKGQYVQTDQGHYIDIAEIRRGLNSEDIAKEIQKIRHNHMKDMKFSWNENIGLHGSYVPDPNGTHLYIDGEFIDIS